MRVFRRRETTNDAFEGFALGDPVRDTLTGLKGVITARNETITGCNQVHVQPRGDDPTKIPDGYWLDVERVESDPDGETVSVGYRRTGCDVPLPSMGGKSA